MSFFKLWREPPSNMKRVFAAIVPAFLFLILWPTTRDELSWYSVSLHDSAAGYQRYLSSWPIGRHATQAKTLLEAYTWIETLAIDTITSYERYAHVFPCGPHIAEARTRIIDLVWEQSRSPCLLQSAQAYVAHYQGTPNGESVKTGLEDLIWNLSTNANTIRSLRAYAGHYPEGRFLAEANTRQATLITNEAVYLTTLSQGSAEAFLRFLREYPGHDKEREAKQTLINFLEGQNADVFASGKVERF